MIRTEDLVRRLVAHPLYEHIRAEDTLRVFMRAHVFCVWDFQSLLKALQRALTCVEVPWLPTPDREARRLINVIVLDEESDEEPRGGHASHFELYLEAMRDCGADAGPIEGFLEDLRRGRSVEEALARGGLPAGVPAFVRSTLEVARSGRPHRVAAAFTYGREEIIPAMFRRLAERLAASDAPHWLRFLYYLNRHIERDEERHGPQSRALVDRLCGDDRRLWKEAEETARAALEARLALWDEIFGTIRATA